MILQHAAALIFLAWMIPITLIDLRSRRIPDLLSISLAVVLVGERILCSEYSLLQLIVGGTGTALILWSAGRISGRGIGQGDVKLGVSAGVLLPGISWIPALAIASISALAIFAARERSTRIPFAPFILIGAISIYISEYLLGRPLLGW